MLTGFKSGVIENTIERTNRTGKEIESPRVKSAIEDETECRHSIQKNKTWRKSALI